MSRRDRMMTSHTCVRTKHNGHLACLAFQIASQKFDTNNGAVKVLFLVDKVRPCCLKYDHRMPTLVEVPLDASMDSISQNDGSSRPHDEETFMNDDDSTRLLDETVLLGNDTSLRSQQYHNEDAVGEDNGASDQLSFDDNDETRLGDVTNLNDDTILGIARQLRNKEGPKENMAPILQYEKPVAAKRTIGPKEEHYKDHFESYVTHLVADFRRHNPEKLKDYRSMSPSEKEEELNRINSLLSRLGGGTTTTVQHCRTRVDELAPVALAEETSGDSSATRLGHDHSDSLTDQSNPANYDHSPPPENYSSASLLSARDNEDVDMLSGESNQSAPLLSPESEVDDLADRMTQSMALSPSSNAAMSPAARDSQQYTPSVRASQRYTSPARDSQRYRSSAHDSQFPVNDDSSASSVEIVRRTESARSTPSSEMYESPTITTNRSKRLASVSGKRGTDQSRMKLDEESFISFDASAPRASEMIASPSQLLCSSIKSSESPLFQASQSPIGDEFSSPEKSPVAVRPARLEVYEDNHDDTLQSHDQTTNYRRKVRWNEESFLQEIPANVHLKEGAPFRMKPLRVGRPSREEFEDAGRRRRQVEVKSLPDPLGYYEGPLRKKVKAAYAWMKERDAVSDTEDDTNAGLLFSMEEGQIIDVTMKLCIKHMSDHNLKEDAMDGNVLSGGTLVVARTKEDLEVWQSSLRECTAFSVLNHATMSVDERKRAATANRCAGYDVVVTTFDALKSKDIATPLDSNGHAIHEKIGFQDGWYSARSSGSETSGRCEQLSVLHQISWRRVVFVDALGRKSFVAKPSTARAVAAVALSASSR